MNLVDRERFKQLSSQLNNTKLTAGGSVANISDDLTRKCEPGV